MALAMARMAVADGTTILACTPHIFPGVYNNTGPQILAAIDQLRIALAAENIPLHLVQGGDVHIAPDLVAKLSSGEALSLNGSRYVLVEPPHHILPPRVEDLFFDLLSTGYVPILTHPERMGWIEREFELVEKLFDSGVWMQLTAGAITGNFGRRAQRWSEKMLEMGMVHIVASDGHDPEHRPPVLGEARKVLVDLVGEEEAHNLLFVRPNGILYNKDVFEMPPVASMAVAADDTAQSPSIWGHISGWFRER